MLNVHLPYDLANPLLGIYGREVKAYIHTKIDQLPRSPGRTQSLSLRTSPRLLGCHLDKKSWLPQISDSRQRGRERAPETEETVYKLVLEVTPTSSVTFYSLEASPFQPTAKGKGVYLYLLRRQVSKNLWTYL